MWLAAWLWAQKRGGDGDRVGGGLHFHSRGNAEQNKDLSKMLEIPSSWWARGKGASLRRICKRGECVHGRAWVGVCVCLGRGREGGSWPAWSTGGAEGCETRQEVRAEASLGPN